ncbi:unnamed protein product, partial [Anisakis simplex]|uniref:N-acetyl-D-glucosamine kinase n=1 Tax=Anisakis simplex TaxID=6269 RepID=A0A0M3K0Y9_ANISI
NFISANHPLFHDATILELGAGATGIPGIVASKCGAKFVIFSDHPRYDEGIDWESEQSVKKVLDRLGNLNFILASDLFFDGTVFESLISTIAHILEKFPKAHCYFTYEERDSDWCIEDLLILNSLCCDRISKIQINRKTIHLGVIYSNKHCAMNSTSYFAGIEGGATHSQLVIVDKKGKKYGEWSHTGLNYYLEGFDTVANEVAVWIRGIKSELNINGPLGAVVRSFHFQLMFICRVFVLIDHTFEITSDKKYSKRSEYHLTNETANEIFKGMGLSGAEDEAINRQLVDILEKQHSDVAKQFFLTTDSVVTIAATFHKGGVVLIAGTGSTARLLKADGRVFGVGGWGHQIGDGGSGFWIANRVIRYIFDDDDGLVKAPYPTETVKRILLEHFNLGDKIEMLTLLYAKFEKANIASFTGKLVKEAPDDPLVKHVFHKAGVILGSHIRAISSHFDEEMFLDVPVVLVGSVFKSWSLLKDGFEEGVFSRDKRGNHIKKVTLYNLDETPAVGAALLAAQNIHVDIPYKHTSKVVDVLQQFQIHL